MACTLSDRLADFFRARPGVWVDGRVLSEIGGCYAWRTRLSELRRPPFNMDIRNRQRRVRRPDGRGTYTVSEYYYFEERRIGEGVTVGAPTLTVTV